MTLALEPLGVVDARLDGPRRAADDRGHLIDWHVFKEVQNKHLTVPYVETGKAAVQHGGVLGVKPRFFVPGLDIIPLFRERPLGSGPRDIAANMIDGMAPGHPVEPRPQGRRLVQATKATKRRHPDRLKNIERRLVVVHD
jgi:hypothetical protein